MPVPPPVVVYQVVFILFFRSRSLPQFIIKRCRYGSRLTISDGATRVGIPAPGEIGITHCSLMNKLDGLLHIWPGTPLIPLLHHTVISVCSLYKQFPFMRVMAARLDRKSTRLNSSHVAISYAVF